MSATVAEHVLDVADLQVHYLDAGRGHPIVLLHGGLATAAMSWATPYRLLAGDYRILAPDTRAHGGTSHPGGTLSYARMADDVAALIDALGLDHPVVAGHSDGGQIALEFGRRHPGLASGLVLSGTISEPTDTYLAGIRGWGFTGPGQVDLGRIGAEFGDDLAPTRAAHEHVRTDADWAAFLRDIATLWHTVPAYTDTELAAIIDPTLVITGDGDELATPAQALRLFSTMPDAQLAILPDAGHGAADEPRFWEIVRRFATGLAADQPAAAGA